MQEVIFKIFRPAEWAELQAAGRFDGSPDDLRDGYIHFSSLTQLRETVRKYYADEPRIVLAAISAEALGPDLRWELARGDQLFPHLYGTLLAAHATGVAEIDPQAAIAMADDDLAALFVR